MRKPPSDSTWNQLTPEQRETLEHWLFHENLSYPQALVKVRAEFGLTDTLSSLGRYYRRRARERQVEEMGRAGDAAASLLSLPVDAVSLRTAAVKLVGKTLLKVSAERPAEWAALASLTKLLLDSEQNDIRRDRLKFAERCWDQEITRGLMNDAPQLATHLVEIARDASLDEAGQLRRINEVLYGRKQTAAGETPAAEGRPL